MRARKRKTRESEGKERYSHSAGTDGRCVVADGCVGAGRTGGRGGWSGAAEEPEVIFFLFSHPEIISTGEEEDS